MEKLANHPHISVNEKIFPNLGIKKLLLNLIIPTDLLIIL